VLLLIQLVVVELVLLLMRLVVVELVLLMQLVVVVATIPLLPQVRFLYIHNSTTQLVTHLEMVLPIPLPMLAMQLVVVAVALEFREAVVALPTIPLSQTL
jgi:hypothetical protein